MDAMRVGTGLLAALALACGPRAVITASHGKAYRAAFDQQRLPEAQRRAAPPPGLDSQEAAIIADSYRSSLAPKGSRADEQAPVILLTPQGQQGQRALMPSVPK